MCILPLPLMCTPIWKAIIRLPKPGINSQWKRSKGINFFKNCQRIKLSGRIKRKNGHFRIIQVRTIDSLKETLSYPKDIDTTINLFPKDFESNYNLYETFTLPELNTYIELLRSRGADGLEVYLIEKYVRFTQPFAILILTSIGVIVSARKSRRGVGWQIALGFMLAFIYILFFLLSKGVAEAGTVSTLFAVWLPNIVFSFIGLLLYKTLPR